MKKVILTEDQIKRMMDKLILKEQETDNNQQNQGNVSDTGYKIYFIDATAYAVKTNGKNNFQLFKLQTNGNGGNKYHITKELTTKPVITMLENGLTDLGKNNEEFASNNTYTPQREFDPEDPATYNAVQVQIGRDKEGNIKHGIKKEKITYQKILDEKTENSFDEALYKPWPVKQSEFIPYSITRGIKCVILGNSYPENDVPIFGTLFLMFDRRLPRNYKLKVLTDEPGNQIILGETAVKRKGGYYWLHFEGSWKGSGGHPWDPNEKETPGKPKPNIDPTPTPINFTVDFGSNFESGKYDLDTNYQKNINDKVTEIVNFIKGKKLKNFKLVITPGESKVPNQAPFKEPGSLAAKRGEILKGYLTIALKNALSIDPQIEVSQPIVGKTEWDPKLGKDNDVYKKDQFVRVSVVITA